MKHFWKFVHTLVRPVDWIDHKIPFTFGLGRWYVCQLYEWTWEKSQ